MKGVSESMASGRSPMLLQAAASALGDVWPGRLFPREPIHHTTVSRQQACPVQHGPTSTHHRHWARRERERNKSRPHNFTMAVISASLIVICYTRPATKRPDWHVCCPQGSTHAGLQLTWSRQARVLGFCAMSVIIHLKWHKTPPTSHDGPARKPVSVYFAFLCSGEVFSFLIFLDFYQLKYDSPNIQLAKFCLKLLNIILLERKGFHTNHIIKCNSLWNCFRSNIEAGL